MIDKKWEKVHASDIASNANAKTPVGGTSFASFSLLKIGHKMKYLDRNGTVFISPPAKGRIHPVCIT
jgi:hypothetical protein